MRRIRFTPKELKEPYEYLYRNILKTVKEVKHVTLIVSEKKQYEIVTWTKTGVEICKVLTYHSRHSGYRRLPLSEEAFYYDLRDELGK